MDPRSTYLYVCGLGVRGTCSFPALLGFLGFTEAGSGWEKISGLDSVSRLQRQQRATCAADTGKDRSMGPNKLGVWTLSSSVASGRRFLEITHECLLLVWPSYRSLFCLFVHYHYLQGSLK